ncbi:MAG: bifunctional riboflavin kinase/FAD synthetase [Steroidobacteraceae bacterium]
MSHLRGESCMPLRLVRALGAAGASDCVATIGTFDGLHLGHRALLARVDEQARRLKCASMMITFEPMPREFFAKDNPPARLTSFRERWRQLQKLPLDTMCALRFASGLRDRSGEEFAELLRATRVRHLVIGHDFRAGRNGEATAQWFASEGSRFGFEVEIVPAVTLDGRRVASSDVRAALAGGDFEQARRLLGRRYSMIGRVIAGQKLGRTLGFPTANLRLGRKRTPTDGIFAVRVLGIGGAPRDGVASLGTRPTVNGTVPLLEAHVFDFNGDLYGREIEVEFVARLRDELKFSSLDAMVVQMHRDAAQAREILSREFISG